MKIIVIALAGIILLSGCHHLNIRDFERSQYVSTSDNRSGLILYTSSDQPQDMGDLVKSEIDSSQELGKVLDQYCRPEEKVAPGLIPIIAAFGQYAFESYLDKQSKDAKKLKKAATSTYSEIAHMKAGQFKGSRCAIIYRANTKEKNIKYLAVLRFKNHGTAFSFSPVYVRAKGTSAVTKKPEEGKFAKINASIALSVKAIGEEKNGLPKLEEIGGGVVTVQNVKVGPDADAITCNKDCVRSDLIPYLMNSDQIISVKVAVSEMGKLGVDIDEKVAEYEALKEAFGPSISEAIKFRLNELYGAD